MGASTLLKACICAVRPAPLHGSAFCFILYWGEAFKPTNTGRLVADVIAEGARQGRSVSVCGEMAGDVAMTRLLLGLGLRSFSMQPAQILAVKQEVLRADARKLGEWAQQLLDADDPAASLQAP